ncbi:hypothetical protein E2C01_007803 [Portunus trituberculatus]|uniref:Reverse transcriptase domain-containing protein n=1 Tax=Portunus trituberculatus TaxID=210409 RepID=A0A5B7D1D9_PORTR|nr:hypothetical protein [Portunus trituberculatus]
MDVWRWYTSNIKKAFDIVPHGRLLWELESRLRGIMLNWIRII